ncbi:MAG TPA: BatD family protein [Phycisphaerae bacterium]|nr:BatD family protein [Phycisphaerae bacterium]
MRSYANIGAIVAIVLAGTGAAARAGEVNIQVSSDEVFAGVPFIVQISVSSADAHQAPDFPQLDDATVQLVNQGTSNSSFQMTINGRRVQQRTTVSYAYQVTAAKPGTLKIPPVEVTVDGEKKYTRPLLLRVSKVETNDLLYVDLKAEKEQVYVGEPVDLTLQIYLQPFAGQGYRLDANDMWRMIDKEKSSWGPFLELLQQRNPRVTFHNESRAGEDGAVHQYIVYEMTQRVWAERPGPLIPDDLRVVVSYPLRIGRSNDAFSMFDGPRITQSKPLVGTITESPVTVKPIPTEGRPPYYRGAVGPHTITASASPTDAQVGDPITLTITVRSAGRLDSLQAPPLAELSAFNTRFQVSDDPLPGVVSDGQKRFTQSLRALNATVTEVPPIPFAYFDPDQEKFKTVYTEAIPLKISPAEKMSATQIVQAGAPEDRHVDTLTHSVYGIESNYVDPAALLAQQQLYPSMTAAAVAGGCPVIYAAFALLVRRRRKLESDTGLRRRRGAKRTAQRAISEAKGRPDGLADALLGYVADRLNVPAGGLTRQEAVQRLRSAGVPGNLVAEVDEVLADCEAAQFGGGAASGADLEPRVRRELDALVRAGV